jgi:hypothetical protein
MLSHPSGVTENVGVQRTTTLTVRRRDLRIDLAPE